MSVHTPVNRKGIYFITFTCFNWLHLIEITKAYDLVCKWFHHLYNKRNFISGYVIMPNHIHILIYYANTSQNLNLIIGNGKRFLAYDIVRRLKELSEFSILSSMHHAVKQTDKERNKKHEIWREHLTLMSEELKNSFYKI
ncbi:MAG: hypothetical protein ACR2KB_01355 [Chitinophagaceae bacterium]